MGHWLESQVALVIGGGSGIGAGVVEAFVEEGAQVVVFDLSRDRAEDVCAKYGKQVVAVAGDATNRRDCDRAVRAAIDSYSILDTVVCCVGIFDFYAGMAKLDDDRLDKAFTELFDVNVKSGLVAISASLPELQRNSGSVILTISSSGYRAIGGGVLYGATKWALRGLVVHLARDLAPEVRVNGVAPGGTAETHLTGPRALDQDNASVDDQLGRNERIVASNVLGVLPVPKDHASAYVYLASKQHARIVTGTVINTDGGAAI